MTNKKKVVDFNMSTKKCIIFDKIINGDCSDMSKRMAQAGLQKCMLEMTPMVQQSIKLRIISKGSGGTK